MFNKKLLKSIDLFTLVTVILLIAIGIVAISSATHAKDTGDYSAVRKQIIWFIIGLIAMTIIISIDYSSFRNLAIYLYIFGLILLVAVLIFGEEAKGAKSWFVIPGIGSIQPSEFVKIIVIMSFAKHLEKIGEVSEEEINKFKNLFLLVIHMLLPIFLIMRQPDWGTAAVFICIMFVMLFIANISYKYIFSTFAAAAIVIPLSFFFVMKEYQRERILVFLDPDRDPLDRGYHVIQSKIAIGSGQVFGKGLYKGVQTQLGFLPEQDTDFIFSVIGEELGFIWCSVIIVLFVMLLLRFIYLSTLAKDKFGTYVIIGITAMLFTHIFINIGMTMGLVPVTGIPLPFISRGGSSLLTNMIAVGLVLNIAMRRQKIKF